MSLSPVSWDADRTRCGWRVFPETRVLLAWRHPGVCPPLRLHWVWWGRGVGHPRRNSSPGGRGGSRGKQGACWHLWPIHLGPGGGAVQAPGQGRREAGGCPPGLVTWSRAAAAGPRPLPGCPRTRQPSLPDAARRWVWRVGPQVRLSMTPPKLLSTRLAQAWLALGKPPSPSTPSYQMSPLLPFPVSATPSQDTHAPPILSAWSPLQSLPSKACSDPHCGATPGPAPSVLSAEMSYS